MSYVLADARLSVPVSLSLCGFVVGFVCPEVADLVEVIRLQCSATGERSALMLEKAMEDIKVLADVPESRTALIEAGVCAGGRMHFLSISPHFASIENLDLSILIYS